MWRSAIGYVVFLLVAWFCCGRDMKLRKNWSVVIYGILFQVLLVFALVHVPVFISAIKSVADGVMKLRDATIEGTKFVFGYVGGGSLPFDIKPGSTAFILAFQALPTVITVGAVSAVLTHMKILPVLAKVIGSIFRFVFRIKNSMGIVAAAKIFVGQLEAPLLIKNKLANLSRSDMFIILSLAFATSSAATMPVYASIIEGACPAVMSHLIISNVLGVISVLIICSIMMPGDNNTTELSETMRIGEGSQYTGFMNALSTGISDGFSVWWCIVGSLIGMVAFIAMVNYILALFPDIAGGAITLQRIFGFFMYPFAWLIGIQEQDISAVSQILGTRLAINEVVAFFDLAKANISADSVVKTIYAINNFGNFACIGITVGGMLALAPGQKSITELAGKAFIAGLLATGLTAAMMSTMFSI